jgi:CspA family cold shock protein
MAEGIVKWFNSRKGYGFIAPKDGSSDIFVHISALERANIRDLQEGQKIQYETAMDKGKVSAVNLVVLN